MTRLTCLLTLIASLASGQSAPLLPLTSDDVIVFTGGTEVVEMQQSGHLETLLTARSTPATPKFRDLAWEADTVSFQGTVHGQWRTKGHFDDIKPFGNWATQLKKVGATAIIMQYGAIEILQGQRVDAFTNELNLLLEEFTGITKRLVLLSPAPFEGELAKYNPQVTTYARIMERVARDRGLIFVDLTKEPIDNRTRNGWITAPNQRHSIAEQIATQLGIEASTDWKALEPLRQAIIEKHRLWTDYWRPANWKCLFGDDGKRGFSKASHGLPSFQEEWAIFPKLIAKAENQVVAIAKGDDQANEWAPLAPTPRTGSSDADIDTELAAFTTTDGYSMNLFADESMGIANPLSIRWDPEGRLYVACTYVYPQIDPGAKPDDTIIVLEDTNGDGRADTSTIFATGLNIPTGMELGNGGVYVGQNTQLLFLKDTDGDLRADERTVVLSGFGNGDSHQTSNGFVWSPGGELFFCQGDGIESRVETPHGVSGLYGPGAFRYRPNTMQLDGMLNNFMGPGNPWGIAFDDWGQAIIIDGAGGISHLTPAFLPVKRKLKLPRIGDPGGYCGIDVLASNRFPDEMRNDFDVGDYKKNQITRFSTIPDGAGFKVKFKPPLLKSNHRNFRPVDVRVGPDGGVYVADFYNPIICHQDDFYRIPVRDKTHGRIWRMAPTGQRFTVPAFTGLDELKSLDRWTRYQAKRVLTHLDSESITQWAASQNDDRSNLEGLQMLETIDQPNQRLLEVCLNSNKPRIRAYATRVLGRWADRLTDPFALLAPRLVDEDIRVRLESALACGTIQHPASIHHLLTLSDQPMDRWVTYAFKQAVESLKPQWLPRFKEGDLTFSSPRYLDALVRAADSKILNKIERERILDDTLPLTKRAVRLQSLIARGESADLTLAFRPEFQATALPAIVSMTREGSIDRNHPDDIGASLTPLLTHKDSTISRAAIELVGLWKKNNLTSAIIAIVEQGSNTQAAIESLGLLESDRARQFLSDLATNTTDLETRWRTITALTRHDPIRSSQLAATLLGEEHDFNLIPLLKAFTANEPLAKALDDTLTNINIPPATANRAIQALVSIGSNDNALRSKFIDAAGLTNQSVEYSRAYIGALAKEVTSHGDASRGQDIFRRPTMSCDACHQVQGVGGQQGPDLTAIGNAVPLERLIEEVVWPQRQIKEGYNLLQIVLDDGEIVSGYEDKNQDENALYVRDPTTQKVRRIRKRFIEKRVELGSAMPAGLVGSLNREELRDLIRFLNELGTQKKNPGKN
ncbi:MAG: hypothetical protein GWQ08_18715 [Verrucomicrobiaceae bacterium]|nr:hypothetical protein [Verrucomicrobiaceae bacterium]